MTAPSGDTDALLTQICENWRLPHFSDPSDDVCPSLQRRLSTSPSQWPAPLAQALHTLSELTVGKMDRANGLMSTYFLQRINEERKKTKGGGENGPETGTGTGNAREEADIQVEDVEKAIESLRRIIGGQAVERGVMNTAAKQEETEKGAEAENPENELATMSTVQETSPKGAPDNPLSTPERGTKRKVSDVDVDVDVEVASKPDGNAKEEVETQPTKIRRRSKDAASPSCAILKIQSGLEKLRPNRRSISVNNAVVDLAVPQEQASPRVELPLAIQPPLPSQTSPTPQSIPPVQGQHQHFPPFPSRDPTLPQQQSHNFVNPSQPGNPCFAIPQQQQQQQQQQYNPKQQQQQQQQYHNPSPSPSPSPSPYHLPSISNFFHNPDTDANANASNNNNNNGTIDPQKLIQRYDQPSNNISNNTSTTTLQYNNHQQQNQPQQQPYRQPPQEPIRYQYQYHQYHPTHYPSYHHQQQNTRSSSSLSYTTPQTQTQTQIQAEHLLLLRLSSLADEAECELARWKHIVAMKRMQMARLTIAKIARDGVAKKRNRGGGGGGGRGGRGVVVDEQATGLDGVLRLELHEAEAAHEEARVRYVVASKRRGYVRAEMAGRRG
ncbi:hypothetical protein K504DRAFT_450122 [Pleomassaria siparia CBS 279.74]|uniref:Uncharacterized protein n=1 Tax=Pleomassaria siparia CBS 279.74 TaxID=1314801 RepID=A0A6G1KLC1_9PLEO|nr:hypothetical protein K504DRAFT_450122 [Pleomassaria siparia CBS 279.74]